MLKRGGRGEREARQGAELFPAQMRGSSREGLAWIEWQGRSLTMAIPKRDLFVESGVEPELARGLQDGLRNVPRSCASACPAVERGVLLQSPESEPERQQQQQQHHAGGLPAL
jgi:hypothetical protein